MKKIAIVTGCSKGIGREITLELARDGYDIIGTYNTSLEEAKGLSERVKMIGVNLYPYKLDLLDDKSIDSFLKFVKSNYGNIDLLVNNAALSLDNEIDYKTSDEFIDVLKVNLIGPFLLIKELYKIMNNGIIINISSTNGINTYTKLDIDYSASKAGLINLTKSLALTLDNVKLYAICPNWVNTESIKNMDQEYLKSEMKRVGQKGLISPKTIANKVIDLAQGNLDSGSIIVVEDNYE